MQKEAQVGMSGESCTKIPTMYTGSMCGRKIKLIDTPGFNDTAGMSNEAIVSSVLYEICINSVSKTVDCFLIADSLSSDKSMTGRIMNLIK